MLKKEGGQRFFGHFDTDKEATVRARQISRNQKTKIVIHNRDGSISQKDSHGNDSLPAKG